MDFFLEKFSATRGINNKFGGCKLGASPRFTTTFVNFMMKVNISLNKTCFT